ncbi:MAG: hypothetical protein AB7P03_07240 [Kofleriaceae bacterium]
MLDKYVVAGALVLVGLGAACVMPEDGADDSAEDIWEEADEGGDDGALSTTTSALTGVSGQLTTTLISSSCSGATSCGPWKNTFFTGSGANSVWLTGSNPHAYGTSTVYVTVCARNNQPNVLLTAKARVESGAVYRTAQDSRSSGATGKTCAFAYASISMAKDYVPTGYGWGTAKK